MINNYSKKWSFIVFIICITLILIYTSEGIFSINNWVYYSNGDALKNYFHVLFSVENADNLWLNKVNYPFGEQIFFLDAQVLLTEILSLLHLKRYTIGFINALPLLSFALASIPIFFIQRSLKIPLILNIVTSVIIALLAPQIARTTVHFALAYSFYIPSIIYLLINENKKYLKKYLLIFILITAFSFLHPYYLLIGIVMLIAFLSYHIFFERNNKAIIYNIISILLPLLIIKFNLILTDNITDRPEFPFGIGSYKSTFEDVFVPRFKPFLELLKAFNFRRTFEGNAYVGVLGFPTLIVSGIHLVINIINKRDTLHFFKNKKFQYFFIASIIIWLFALYYPFKLIIDNALELIPPLKQFRSLGRFGWIFYYTFSFFISLSLSKLFYYLKNKTNVKVAIFSIFILCSLWFIDANANMNTIKEAIKNRTEISINKSEFLSDSDIEELKKHKFDVILTLPIFHVGSEIENYEGSSLCLVETFKIANICNIPYTSTYSSRVSKNQFYKIKKLKFNGNLNSFYSKNEKILIIADKTKLNNSEKNILEKSNILYETEYIIYSFVQL